MFTIIKIRNWKKKWKEINHLFLCWYISVVVLTHWKVCPKSTFKALAKCLPGVPLPHSPPSLGPDGPMGKAWFIFFFLKCLCLNHALNKYMLNKWIECSLNRSKKCSHLSSPLEHPRTCLPLTMHPAFLEVLAMHHVCFEVYLSQLSYPIFLIYSEVHLRL